MTTETQVETFKDTDPKDYWALLKPRVMSLVVFTAAAGLWVAPGDINPLMAIVAILAIATSAGAAGAINMWYDRDIDAIMKRTAERPLPKGLIEPDNALGFGIFLSLASFMVMGLATNWTAAFILAGANLFYVVIYTMWLKRSTPQNIVIGGAAGAFPPMIGWAAVTGDVTLVSFSLFLLIFLWTPPHFWALAIYIKTDYGDAGVPMMPNVRGKRTTKRQMLYYAISMIPVAAVPWWLGS
ncbi:MAG: heme o synthase, partial [Alphaproteobacteria bacterium]